MFTYPNVYVYISGDRSMFGLTINLTALTCPTRPFIGGWQGYDVIPMTFEIVLIRYMRMDPNDRRARQHHHARL